MACNSHPRRLTAALGLALLACDPGFSVQATVIVPDDVAAAYSPEQRGLLLVHIITDGYDDELFAVDVVCGDGGTFGAGSSSLGTLPTTIIQAWIEPLPADDDRPCGEVPVTDREHFDPNLVDVDVDDDEPQARATITPETGCDASGTGDAELTIAAP